MDFGGILTRAWQITWRWKVLWILGFLAGLGSIPNPGNNSRYELTGNQLRPFGLPSINLSPGISGLLVGLACVAVIVGILLWVLSVMARGGLIAAVAQIEDEGSTTLGRAWAVGQRRFWTLFGISVLMLIPVIILVVLAVASAAAVFLPWFTVTNAAANEAPRTGLAVAAVAFFCCLVCGGVLAGLILEQIRTYAERAAILEGLNWTAAFGRGWRVLRDNIGPTLILWLIFLVLAIAFGIVTLIILSPLLLPFAALSAQNQNGSAFWVLFCGAGLVALVVGAIVNSVVQVFTSATWTLTYRALTGRGRYGPAAAAPAAPPMAPPPPPPSIEG